MKIRKSIAILAALGCMHITGGVLAAHPRKLAAAEALSFVSDFQMQYGASVRFGTTDGKDGIRFTAEMSADSYNALEALQTDESVAVNYGMLIVPADYGREGSSTYKAPLTKDTIFGTNALYTLVDCTPEADNDGCDCGKTHIASVEYETLGGGDKKVVRGSLVDLKTYNRMREFVGVGYIEYVNGTTTQYILAEHAKSEDGTGESDIENNTRSMSYVAQLAIEDDKDDENDTLYKTYVQPFLATEYKYTVYHYLPDSDGEYGVPVVETAYATLGASVTAKHIVESSLENKAEYLDFTGYTLDETHENAVLESTVYANGNTELHCYYLPPQATETRLLTFDDESQIGYLAATEKNGVTPTISYVSTVSDGQTEKTGVAAYATSTAKYVAYGAYFYLNLSEEMIDALWTALDDKTTSFTLEITLLVEAAGKQGMQIGLSNSGVTLVNATVGAWQTHVISEETLSTLFTDEASARNYLSGETNLFFIGSGFLGKNQAVTYYIDGITYRTE